MEAGGAADIGIAAAAAAAVEVADTETCRCAVAEPGGTRNLNTGWKHSSLTRRTTGLTLRGDGRNTSRGSRSDGAQWSVLIRLGGAPRRTSGKRVHPWESASSRVRMMELVAR